MKKIFGIITLFFFLGCDDGDIIFKDFNFGTANIQSCTNNRLVLKVNGSQALILDLDPAAFYNIETPEGQPRIITVNSTNRVLYRNYTSNVSASAFCSNNPLTSLPPVAEEWVALPGGTVTVETIKRFNEQDVLVGYNHIIRLSNITFTRGEETLVLQDNDFGTFQKALGYTFDFLDDENNILLNDCGGSAERVFRVNGSETLLFDLAAGTFSTTPGTVTVDLANTGDDNQVVFTRYAGSASNTFFCSSTPPVVPVTGQWFATAGQLTVTTTEATAGGYNHVITLVNAVFSNTIGETIIVTNGTSPEYRIGTYNTN
ncbi:hypothetical protein CHU92_02470 [Flavobacterium cyanobacteriorum]|uniref:Uncharacterized protein n=1 Tax=Flavobacterium cyanobacteriorum TaxID=2022802 RepID=A0A255ZSF2_9FLAO|nr:hypothetical protein [Flavobacterium cyanobacteriorum]OYQ44366.1 hypothetical protein CHU92_02470 [Flavobacterium cyanobacteriorum]